MRVVIVFLLSFSIGLQHSIQLSVYAWYNFNKQVISEKLCVNKSNPKLHCEGRCFLGKQLKKAEEGEKRTATNILKEKDEYVNSNNTHFCFEFFCFNESKLYFPILQHIPTSPVFDIINPPG